MKSFLKPRLALMLLFVIWSAILSAQAQKTSKSINKSFQVNRDAELIVDNSFGKIHCEVWDKNEVVVEAEITAVASSLKESERLLANVKVDIRGNADKVEAITTMEEKSSRGNKSVVTVDYSIKLPRTLRLNLSNKFGDIFLDENAGSSLINLSYGNLQANRLAGQNHELNMKFSKGNLGTAEHLKLEVSYSELRAREITKLAVDSKFSTLEIENTSVVSQESQYDTSELGETREVKSVAKFSTIRIGSVSEQLDLDMKYGGCTVKEIGPSFKQVKVTNSFGNIDLQFNPQSSFQLDAASSFGGVTFPKGSDITVDETSHTSRSYKGTIGKESRPQRVVNISTRNGDVNIRINK